ncbi:MAG: hypothetical protein FE834_05495 [Gammaproteobacteria bacterium]|nr:hypothetical protein [Gammaproteobacteria bacterium]
MSLLRNIQESAIDANEPISVLLRQCKILAARLGSPEFKNWVEYELNGYAENDDIPKYRIMTVMCKGHFVGPFGSSLNNVEIPSRSIPEDFREGLFTSYLILPISAIESLIDSSNNGTIAECWSTDITAVVGAEIYQEMNCLQAWKVIPVNTLVGILDMIRNKVLDFVLEIESENPQAGDASLNSQPVAKEKVQQIFNTYISGNVQNIAIGNKDFKQISENGLNDETFNNLLDALKKVKNSNQITSEFTSIVEEMKASKDSSDFKKSYKKFISVLSDHMQVYGPVVAPFLPALAAIIP